eukprot:scaffold28249_cov14-Prasinocladus_malaysianus.AAC.2
MNFVSATDDIVLAIGEAVYCPELKATTATLSCIRVKLHFDGNLYYLPILRTESDPNSRPATFYSYTRATPDKSLGHINISATNVWAISVFPPAWTPLNPIPRTPV